MRSTACFTWRRRRSWSRRSCDGARAEVRLRLPNLPHDRARELFRIVVGWLSGVHDVRRDESDLRVPRDVRGPEDHRGLTAGRRVGRVRVDEHEIEKIRADVLADHTKVVLHPVTVGLAWLSRQVADVKLQCRGRFDRLDHALDEKVRQDGRVEGTRAANDQLRVEDRLRGFRVDLHAVRLEEDMTDRRVLLGDLRLALYGASVDRRYESHVAQGRRQDGALDRQNFSGFAERLLEVSGDVGHRHDEEVSERVAVERAFLETMVEELFHQRLRICERDEALAEVAGWKDSIFIAQPSGRSTVVGDGHDR